MEVGNVCLLPDFANTLLSEPHVRKLINDRQDWPTLHQQAFPPPSVPLLPSIHVQGGKKSLGAAITTKAPFRRRSSLGCIDVELWLAFMLDTF